MEGLVTKGLENKSAVLKESLVIDPNKMDNAVLKRLIGEIDFERTNMVNSYNRTHNRHNRGR